MLGSIFAQATFYHNRMDVISTVECSTVEQVKENFQKVVNTGGEGLVVKKIDGMWKHGTSKDQLKVKVVVDCDLKIVEWKEGLGKYSGMVGAIRVQSSDGVIDTWVGSGLSDGIRKNTKMFDDAVESGKIVCVRYNDVVESENTDRVGLKSLYLPRFIEVREDKTEADSSQRVINQLKQINLF
jgi:DNA ligase-1